MSTFNSTLSFIKAGGEPSKDMIIALLAAQGSQADTLLKTADEVRRASVGNIIYTRAIVEFSNYCSKNCLYCGLRRDNKAIPRYRLTSEQIMDSAAQVASLGIKTIVLQSGEDRYYSPEQIAQIISKIKEKYDLTVTLSVGEHTFKDYRLWREAGADRFLLKHETADAKLFRYLRPDSTLNQRLQCIQWLNELDYETGMGNMVGLPGQNLDTMARDALLMRRMKAKMAGVGPFLPHPSTPLKCASPGDLMACLKMLAVTRLVLPYANLPVTTALRVLSPEEGLKLSLQSGANVIMPNMTPLSVRENYVIYPQKADLKDSPQEVFEDVKLQMQALDRSLDTA